MLDISCVCCVKLKSKHFVCGKKFKVNRIYVRMFVSVRFTCAWMPEHAFEYTHLYLLHQNKKKSLKYPFLLLSVVFFFNVCINKKFVSKSLMCLFVYIGDWCFRFSFARFLQIHPNPFDKLHSYSVALASQLVIVKWSRLISQNRRTIFANYIIFLVLFTNAFFVL